MSLHRRTFALAALAALGATAGLASAPASASPTPQPAYTCTRPEPGRLMNTLCRTSDRHPGSGDERWGRWHDGRPDRDGGRWNGPRHDGPYAGDSRWRGPHWQEPRNHGPFPPYAGNPGWPRRSGPLGPPF